VYFQESYDSDTGEVHCYFPEWADRPPSPGITRESHQNSYMAGGYAEEFGYLACVSCPPVFPVLDGDPEHNSLWRVQMGGLHPGYPECARPLDRIHSGADLAPAPDRHSSHSPPNLRFEGAEVRFTAVPVRRNDRVSTIYPGSWWRAWRILRRGMSRTV
jgi:hypothetical protein